MAVDVRIETVPRNASRVLLAFAYFVAGIAHLRSPEGFLQITPGWVPFPDEVIAFTGIAEILGAIGLMFRHFRHAAGIGLALYAACVFPANINHAINDIAIGGRDLSWWYHGPRLVLQPVLVWLALWVGNVTAWPFANQSNDGP